MAKRLWGFGETLRFLTHLELNGKWNTMDLSCWLISHSIPFSIWFYNKFHILPIFHYISPRSTRFPPRSTPTTSNPSKLTTKTKSHTSYFYIMKIKRFHQYNYNLLPIDFSRSSKIIKIGWKRNIFEVRAFTYVYMFAVPWLKIQ